MHPVSNLTSSSPPADGFVHLSFTWYSFSAQNIMNPRYLPYPTKWSLCSRSICLFSGGRSSSASYHGVGSCGLLKHEIQAGWTPAGFELLGLDSLEDSHDGWFQVVEDQRLTTSQEVVNQRLDALEREEWTSWNYEFTG